MTPVVKPVAPPVVMNPAQSTYVHVPKQPDLGSERVLDSSGLLVTRVITPKLAQQARSVDKTEVVSFNKRLQSLKDVIEGYRKAENQITFDRFRKMGEVNHFDWEESVNEFSLHLKALEDLVSQHDRAYAEFRRVRKWKDNPKIEISDDEIRKALEITISEKKGTVQELRKRIGTAYFQLKQGRFFQCMRNYDEQVKRVYSQVVPLYNELNLFGYEVGKNSQDWVVAEISYARPEELRADFHNNFESIATGKLVSMKVTVSDAETAKRLAVRLQREGFLEDESRMDMTNRLVWDRMQGDRFSGGDLFLKTGSPQAGYIRVKVKIRIPWQVKGMKAQNDLAFVEEILGSDDRIRRLGRESPNAVEEIRLELLQRVKSATVDGQTLREMPPERKTELAAKIQEVMNREIEKRIPSHRSNPAVGASRRPGVAQLHFANADDDTNPGILRKGKAVAPSQMI